MASEIERKFLVKSKEWFSFKKPKPLFIKQAFVLQQDKKVLRARIKADKAFLTIKGKSSGVSRMEFEYEIPIEDAEEMISQMSGPTIEKERYEIPFANHLWEVDVFYGENEGLIVAEIELLTETEFFEKPNWVGAEVSYDPRYFNSNLEHHPFNQW